MTVNMHDFIHRYLPAADSAAPTLLLLHGTGGNEQSLLGLGAQLAPGAGLLSPRGKVLEGGAPRFFRRKAEGVFDIEDLIYRTHELADWLAAATVEYKIAPESLIAVGYSNGANIAASLLLLRPASLRRAVLLRPMLPLKPEAAPDLSGAEVLIEAGVADSLIPPRETDRLVQALRGYGAQVMVHQQRADHGLTNADIVNAHEWIQNRSAPAHRSA